MRYRRSVRVVVDTSVFVAAILGSTGPSREVLRRCLAGRLHPLMGAALFLEYESVLGREQKFSECALSAAERAELRDAFLSTCEWVRVYYLWRPNLQDEADNHVMELAVSGNAERVVTNNIRDFTGAELHFSDVRVVKPQELLQEEALQ